MRTKILIMLCTVMLIAGCARTRINGVPIISQDVQTRQAEVQLARAASSIDKSLLEFSAMQRAVYPRVRLPSPPDPRKIGMDQMATIDWTGPIESLIREIAKVSRYRVRVVGKKPAIPIIVSVHYLGRNKAPVATILRNAAFQCVNKVDIVAYPRRRMLELRYNGI